MLTVAVWLSEVNYIYWSTLSQNMWDENCVFSWLKFAIQRKSYVYLAIKCQSGCFFGSWFDWPSCCKSWFSFCDTRTGDWVLPPNPPTFRLTLSKQSIWVTKSQAEKFVCLILDQRLVQKLWSQFRSLFHWQNRFNLKTNVIMKVILKKSC